MRCAGTSELDKHASDEKHKIKVAALNITTSCSTFALNNNIDNKHSRLVKIAEIKICTYLAMHNVALMAA